MHEHAEIFPRATRELNEERKRLAPESADAFRAFSRSLFAEGAPKCVLAAHSRTRSSRWTRSRNGPEEK